MSNLFCFTGLLSMISLYSDYSGYPEIDHQFPEFQVSIKYISKHKKNNALHRLAHNAARKVIGR
jgi:hypothetical protein